MINPLVPKPFAEVLERTTLDNLAQTITGLRIAADKVLSECPICHGNTFTPCLSCLLIMETTASFENAVRLMRGERIDTDL